MWHKSQNFTQAVLKGSSMIFFVESCFGKLITPLAFCLKIVISLFSPAEKEKKKGFCFLMIGVIFFLNSRGDLILSRAFRDGFNIRLLADTFRMDIIAAKKTERSPVNVIDRICYLHMRHENIYVVLCCNANMNCMMGFHYIVRLLQILKSYFGVLDEATVKNNFVPVQFIIDETLDFGYPQLTEADILKSYISVEAGKGEVMKRTKDSEQITIKATGKIPWRKDGLAYATNEAFVAVVEEVNLLASQNGQILQSEVSGRIIMESFLSGMPECKICLNDKTMIDNKQESLQLDDVTFHSCVRVTSFDSDRSICFVPPDGEFILMRYRSSANIKPPLRILSSRVKEVSRTRVEIDFRIKSEFSPKIHGTDIVVKMPCPGNTANVKIRVVQGKAKYDAPSQAILWKIKRLQGGVELAFSAEITLIAATLQKMDKAWSRPPITISFNVGMYAASGLEIQYMQITEPKLNYKARKWVRYKTQGGQYQYRI